MPRRLPDRPVAEAPPACVCPTAEAEAEATQSALHGLTQAVGRQDLNVGTVTHDVHHQLCFIRIRNGQGVATVFTEFTLLARVPFLASHPAGRLR